MHPRLRTQLAALDAAELPLPLRKLLEAVDAEYRAFDAERSELGESLRVLTSLLHRAQSREAESEAARARKRSAAARAARKLARVLDKSRVPVLELSGELLILRGNPAASALCGVSQEELQGKPLFTLLEPLEAEAVSAKWRKKLSRGEPVARTLACTARGGRTLACDFVCVPRLGRDGTLRRATLVLRDETETLEKQEALRESEERLTLALAGSSEAVWDWDLRANRLHLSPRFRELFGAAPLTGSPSDWLDRIHPEDAAPLRAALAAHFEGRTGLLEHEHRIRHADGEWRWMAVRGAALRDASGTAVRMTGLMSEVTRHRLLIERMAHDARHDALTGLPNRTLFLDLLRHSFHRTRRHEEYRFAVLFIDIDRFKLVNDAFGHDAGDQLLVQIARRLESCLREGDTLARHGGDEFTMWLDDVRGSADAVRVSERVHEVMREPFEVAAGTPATPQRVQSSASIGAAVGSSSYKSAEAVLRDADVAMYRAKALGKARTAVFQREPGEAPPAHATLEADLRSALLRNELRIHYMPIVDTATGSVRALEALARWEHPRLGLQPPSKFMEMAVATGLIVSIDQWVLQTASRQLHDWRRELASARKLSMSVNFSQKLLEQSDLGAQIDRVLRESQLLPGDLNLDISESSLAPDNGGGMLAELHRRGLNLNLDDFGTGQAWLRHLYKAEVDSIKIDRSFVTAGAERDRQVLGRLVAIARDLGKTAIAVGVETKEQARLVRELGCTLAQGYFFSPPLDALKTRALLQGGALEVV